MTTINSLCLIPELSCPRNCQYCYEKTKNYSAPMKWREYVSFVKSRMETLPSLTEALIDYNGVESLRNLKDLITHLPTTITTTWQGMESSLSLNASFHLSVHHVDDIIPVQRLLKKHPKRIKCLSLVLGSAISHHFREFGDTPIYFLVNKFSDAWLRTHPAVFAQMIGKFPNLIVDNCVTTRVLGNECPASTQINLYRDGSIRRCPYTPKEPANADYSKGCYLIGDKDESREPSKSAIPSPYIY